MFYIILYICLFSQNTEVTLDLITRFIYMITYDYTELHQSSFDFFGYLSFTTVLWKLIQYSLSPFSFLTTALEHLSTSSAPRGRTDYAWFPTTLCLMVCTARCDESPSWSFSLEWNGSNGASQYSLVSNCTVELILQHFHQENWLDVSDLKLFFFFFFQEIWRKYIYYKTSDH